MFITRFLWLDGETFCVGPSHTPATLSGQGLLSPSAARARDQVDRQESAIRHLSRRLSRRQWLGRTRSVPLRHRLLAVTLKRVA